MVMHVNCKIVYRKVNQIITRPVLQTAKLLSATSLQKQRTAPAATKTITIITILFRTQGTDKQTGQHNNHILYIKQVIQYVQSKFTMVSRSSASQLINTYTNEQSYWSKFRAHVKLKRAFGRMRLRSFSIVATVNSTSKHFIRLMTPEA
jgi:hypothetical protein